MSWKKIVFVDTLADRTLYIHSKRRFMVKTLPNHSLKRERELRGWSQQYVAEHIQAPSYSYISRWECGGTFPSPYYRERLCTLFGKNAYELGFYRQLKNDKQRQSPPRGERRTPEEQARPRWVASPASSPQVTASPPPQQQTQAVAPLFLSNVKTSDLIGRTSQMRSLLGHLDQSKGGECLALYGLPGAGKTELATALINEEALQRLFYDGVLWVTVGVRPNIPELLTRWGHQLGVSLPPELTMSEQTAWTLTLREAIGQRRILFVIDDVWKLEEALAFKVGGPQCVYLLITRWPGIAFYFADNVTIALHELDRQESLTLLTEFVPHLARQEQPLIQELAGLTGGLPLALALIGRYLRTQERSGQPRRVKAAIERLHHTEYRLKLAEPRALLELPAQRPEYAFISLQAAIETSDQQLSEEARQALYALSGLPVKPHSFSEETALAVARTRPEILDQLTDAGLLEGSGPARYMLHQTIADYASLKRKDSVRQGKMIASYMQQCADEKGRQDAGQPVSLTASHISLGPRRGLA